MRFVACAHKRKSVEKLLQKPFLSASRDRSLAKGASVKIGGLKMVPKSSPGTLGRTLGAHLGALGGTLKSCRGALGALGALLGRSWRALGTLLERLGLVLRAVGLYKMLHARFSSFQNRFGIPQELILATPRMDFGGFQTRVFAAHMHLRKPTCANAHHAKQLSAYTRNAIHPKICSNPK